MDAAVIADIVGSRRLPDRAAGQRALDATIARVEEEFPLAAHPLRPVVGDEQQGLYPSLENALASTLLIRLALPEGIDLRFGIGLGEVGTVPGPAGEIPEGPGWWAAREAIESVHALQKRNAPSARTRVAHADGEAEHMGAVVRLANAYLLSRDQVVGAMSDRARRLTYGRLAGRTQQQLAAAEGITQSAVSQALTAAGAGSLIEGYAALTGENAA
jgi:hypothetical protein